jgi:hypothetical protein
LAPPTAKEAAPNVIQERLRTELACRPATRAPQARPR